MNYDYGQQQPSDRQQTAYTPYQMTPRGSVSSSSSSTHLADAQLPQQDWYNNQPSQQPSSLTQHPASTSTSSYIPEDHTRLSPSNFDPSTFTNTFVLPRFAAGGNYATEGPAVAEPTGSSGSSVKGPNGGSGGGGFMRYEPQQGYQNPSFGSAMEMEMQLSGGSGTSNNPSRSMSDPQVPTTTRPGGGGESNPWTNDALATLKPKPLSAPPGLANPVYDLYGSSVISIQPSTSPLVLAPASPSYSLRDQQNSTPPSPSTPFDPVALGLPLPPAPSPKTGGKNWEGLYSSSGIDMIGILAKVATRPNPVISLGPVDLDCSFLVVDARKYDMPIVYASETFSRLTGYSNAEILGRNCRFLQSPEGLVAAGAKRKYTDGNAVYHLKRHIHTGQETQASLINYYKGGKPFINLVTVIPISWGTNANEVTHFVGFQVDLVDQPSAILDKMKNGTYLVNYNVSSQCVPRYPFQPGVQDQMDIGDDAWVDPNAPQYQPTPSATTTIGAQLSSLSVSQPSQSTPSPAKKLEGPKQESVADLLEGVKDGFKGLNGDVLKKQFNKLMLDNSDSLVHVLSLKGTILYLSPSSARLLEYEPSELTGKTLSSVCHPSDIVAVLRELKESGAAKTTTTSVSLLYRIRRKYSGFVWLEAQGKLHVEHGKGRKCVILVGRPQKVYNVSWSDLTRVGGLGEREYWAKYSLDGMYLYSTPSVAGVVGYTSEELVGTQVSLVDHEDTFMKTLHTIATSETMSSCTSVSHKLKAKNGTLVDVVTHFYPNRANSATDRSFTVIAQTASLSSEISKRQSQSPNLTSSSFLLQDSTGASPPSGDESDHPGSVTSSSSSTLSLSSIPSTFKNLPPRNTDNVFDELDTTRGTSWQFELHQLRLTNRKLREEKEAVAAYIIKKNQRMKHPSKTDPTIRSCGNCGRTDSPEWRTGPGGPRTLCNACGLRWAKARSHSSSQSSGQSQGGGSTGSGSRSPVDVPPEVRRSTSGESDMMSYTPS